MENYGLTTFHRHLICIFVSNLDLSSIKIHFKGYIGIYCIKSVNKVCNKGVTHMLGGVAGSDKPKIPY